MNDIPQVSRRVAVIRNFHNGLFAYVRKHGVTEPDCTPFDSLSENDWDTGAEIMVDGTALAIWSGRYSNHNSEFGSAVLDAAGVERFLDELEAEYDRLRGTNAI